MLLHKKYAPHSIYDLAFNVVTLERLVNMSKDNAVPHIILYGPDGSGKRTLARLFLESMYGHGINNTNETEHDINGSGSKPVKVTIKQSDYHVIINPNNNNGDRYLIQEIVNTYAKRLSPIVYQTSKSFRTVLINDVDTLPYHAQMSLRRTMEKYSDTCRFLMICNSLSKLIDPLKSRCVCVRARSPKNHEIINTLLNICCVEKYNLSLDKLMRILRLANRNIKRAVTLLECAILNIPLPCQFDTTISTIVKMIREKELTNVPYIDGLMYEIFITNLSGNTTITEIASKLLCLDNISNETRMKIVNTASKYEHHLSLGRREVFHFDAFICEIILALKAETCMIKS